jgi:ketosteroid isomerase-like protein
MADDVVRLPAMGEAGVAGKTAVGRLDAALFADPARRLRWQPTHAGAFLDGRHGYTTGRYQVVQQDTAGAEEVLGTGAYLTWWRLDEGGAWRVILDTGVPDPQPAK